MVSQQPKSHWPAVGCTLRRPWTFSAGLLLSVACNGGDRTTSYSVAGSAAPAQQTFGASPDVPLALTVDLRGSGAGPDDAFGFVTAATLGPDSSIYVADAPRAHIAVFGPNGTFRRYIGRRGTSPGDLLNPTAVAVAGPKLFVYDAALRRVTAFDTTGRFLRAIPVPIAPPPRDLAVPSEGEFIFSGDSAGAGQVTRYDEGGNLRATYLGAQGQERGRALPGRICLQRATNRVIFANPLTYELAAVDAAGGRMRWVRRWQSDVIMAPRLRPGASESVHPNAIMLGLVCDGPRIIVSYLELATQRLFYDAFTAEGTPTGRSVFTRGRGEYFPGFAAALLGDRLVTFRTKPFSEVFVFRVGESSPGARTQS